MPSSYASVAVALVLGLLAAAAFILAQKKKPRPQVASAAGHAAAAPVKFTEEEHARRRAARLAVLEEMGRKAAEEARVKAEAAAARAAEEKRAAAERVAAEKAAKEKAAAEKAAAEVARLEALRRKNVAAPAPTPSALQAAPRAALDSPSVKLLSSGGAVPAPALASPQQGAAAAPAAPLERMSVGVRVQFVQGRPPLQLTLPLPLPTVGELKLLVHEASGDLLPAERQRLLFAGQILTPDDKDLALFKNFGEGACVICQELAAPSA